MVDSERASLERQLDRRRRNLCKLQEKAAIYAAGEVPLHLQNQIEAEQEAIADIKTRLDSIQIEEGEKEREPAERRKRSPRDWWASLPRETQVAVIRSTGVIIAALISLHTYTYAHITSHTDTNRYPNAKTHPYTSLPYLH
jgi:hypothetical protein